MPIFIRLCVGAASGIQRDAAVRIRSPALTCTHARTPNVQARFARCRPYQLVLLLALVVLSFALHVIFLPAGLCCFFVLMLCKNEVLLPPAPQARAKRATKTD